MSFIFYLIFFSLIYAAIKTIKGKEILTVELKPQTTEFVIEKSGFYALWVHARLFKINPARAYPATILEQDKQPIRRIPITISVYQNGFREGKQIYHIWYLKAGRYYLNVEHKEPKFFKPDEQPNARYQLKETMPLLIPIGIMILMVIVAAIID
ncbi:hypothetical protein [Actinobacillus minor]|uniref:hypothetical protein n=1 Tax=Actinobacillus minor TaxID=51047 RepID=UPI0026E9F990|nr:hypothetical protein [Actinobacillus minor]